MLELEWLTSHPQCRVQGAPLNLSNPAWPKPQLNETLHSIESEQIQNLTAPITEIGLGEFSGLGI